MSKILELEATEADKSKRAMAHLMKMDKHESMKMEQRDLLLERLHINPATKKATKKYFERQRNKDQYGQKVTLFGKEANLQFFLEHMSSFGIIIFLRQAKHIAYMGILMTILIIPIMVQFYRESPYNLTLSDAQSTLEKLTIANMRINQNSDLKKFMQSDFTLCSLYLLVSIVSIQQMKNYMSQTISSTDKVEDHSIHVIFPKPEHLTQDKGKPSLTAMTHAQLAR